MSATVVAAIISGVASLAAGGISAGGSAATNKRNREAAEKQNALSYDTWKQEFEFEKEKEKRDQLQAMLNNSVALRDSLKKIWGNRR